MTPRIYFAGFPPLLDRNSFASSKPAFSKWKSGSHPHVGLRKKRRVRGVPKVPTSRREEELGVTHREAKAVW